MDATVRPRTRVAIIGAGRVGRAFAYASRRAGLDFVGAWSRTDAARRRFADQFGIAPPVSMADAIDACDILIVSVPDEQLDSVLREVAERTSATNDPLVVVTSGSWSIDQGAPIVAAGGRVVRIHPLRAITDASAPDVLDGVVAAVTAATDPDRVTAHTLAATLGMEPFELADADAATWHAAGAIAAGGVTTLLAAARDLAFASGLAPDAALRALADLARGAIDDAVAQTPELSLTGPVVRGDAATVAAHVDALHRRRPDLLDTYRSLSRATAALAHRAGRIDEDACERIDIALAHEHPAPTVDATWA